MEEYKVPAMMKAVVCSKYGGPELLKLKEVPVPTPAKDQLLVKVFATSVNAADWHLMQADPWPVRLAFGMFRPRANWILGMDIAGVVVAVGKNCKNFKVGDEVFGDSSVDLGLGAYAEYALLPEKAAAKKPKTWTMEQCASVPGAAATALQGLRNHGKIAKGMQVLVVGASGGVGAFAVQIAKYFEAEVTAVARSSKLDFVRSLGPDRVVDSEETDVCTGEAKYDLILDCAAFRPISDYDRLLTETGKYVLVGGSFGAILDANLSISRTIRRRRKPVSFTTSTTAADLQLLAEIIDAGKMQPIVCKTLPLEETGEAIKLMLDRKVSGKIVVSVSSESL